MDFRLGEVLIRGYAGLQRLELNLSHATAVGDIQIVSNPDLVTINVVSAVGFRRSKISAPLETKPNLVPDLQRRIRCAKCQDLMQPYGWAAVPNRVWDESCICVLSANGDAEGHGTTVDGHNDVRCTRRPR